MIHSRTGTLTGLSGWPLFPQYYNPLLPRSQVPLTNLRVRALPVFDAPGGRAGMHALESAPVEAALLLTRARCVVVLSAHVRTQTPENDK